MQAINKKNIAAMSLLLILSVTILSFAPGKGGEGFEIYLGNKLVLQKFGSQMDAVKNLQLDQRFSNEQLIIKYHHCGRAGKNRNITLKDGQNKVLKEWNFADDPKAGAAMSCNIKDILGLKKGNSSTVNLYYSSSELPKGRLLASLVLGSGSVASLQ